MESIHYPAGAWNYFYYDARQRRYAIQDSDGLTYLTWDTSGLRLLAERDAMGEATANYTHGATPIPGIGSTVAVHHPLAGGTYYQYPIMDHRGTVVALTDEDGDQVATYEYNAWGQSLHAADPTGAPNRLRYQTNWLALKDSEGDLYLSPTRVYDGATGRFLGRDREQRVDDYTAYACAPAEVVDPDGMAPWRLSRLPTRLLLPIRWQPRIPQMPRFIDDAGRFLEGFWRGVGGAARQTVCARWAALVTPFANAGGAVLRDCWQRYTSGVGGTQWLSPRQVSEFVFEYGLQQQLTGAREACRGSAAGWTWRDELSGTLAPVGSGEELTSGKTPTSGVLPGDYHGWEWFGGMVGSVGPWAYLARRGYVIMPFPYPYPWTAAFNVATYTIQTECRCVAGEMCLVAKFSIKDSFDLDLKKEWWRWGLPRQWIVWLTDLPNRDFDCGWRGFDVEGNVVLALC